MNDISQGKEPLWRYLEVAIVFVAAVSLYKFLIEIGFDTNTDKIIISYLIFIYFPLLMAGITGSRFHVLSIKQIRIKNEAILILVAVVIVSLASISGYFIGTTFLNENMQSDLQTKTLLSVVFYQFLVIAPTEEVFFRGCLQSRLEGKINTYLTLRQAIQVPSVYISALLFTIFHFILNPSNIELYVFVPGIFYSILKLMSAGLLVPIVAHATSNIAIYIISG